MLRFQANSNNYTVELDINSLLKGSTARSQFARKLPGMLQEMDVCRPDTVVQPLYSLENGLLRYESETLLPADAYDARPRVLLVFGNPAVHSVIHGMFFFSKTNCSRHQLWGKLVQAGLVQEYKSKQDNPFPRREDEAEQHRQMIVTGTASKQFLLGMTTFFSLPTRSEDGVRGVEQLFGDGVDELAAMETQRILSYLFSKDAILVFTQSSTYKRFCTITGAKPIYWPMHLRSSKASGKYLRELLEAKFSKNQGRPPIKDTKTPSHDHQT